jgi:hypothetical protein
MRSISPANLAALQAGQIVPRQFMRITVKDRTTHAPHSENMWSDVGDVTVDLIDPDDGSLLSDITFYGVGDMVQMDPIPLASNLTVQEVQATLSQAADRVNDLLRNYNARQARVDIWDALFDPQTMELVDTAEVAFTGVVDYAPINTPPAGGRGDVKIKMVPRAIQELSRSNVDMRGDESQRLRDPADGFLQDVVSVGAWDIRWGGKRPKGSWR